MSLHQYRHSPRSKAESFLRSREYVQPWCFQPLPAIVLSRTYLLLAIFPGFSSRHPSWSRRKTARCSRLASTIWLRSFGTSGSFDRRTTGPPNALIVSDLWTSDKSFWHSSQNWSAFRFPFAAPLRQKIVSSWCSIEVLPPPDRKHRITLQDIWSSSRWCLWGCNQSLHLIECFRCLLAPAFWRSQW